MSVVIQSGAAWVVDSGSATTFGGASLVLILRLPEDNLMVELCFDSDASGTPRVVSDETATGWRMTCVNFDDASGRGSALPVLLGEVEEDLIFFHFRVFRYGESVDRTVHFTFYRGHKDKLGWRGAGPGPTG